MKTTFVALCTLVLVQAMAEARYGGGSGGGSSLSFVSAVSGGGYGGSSGGGYGGGGVGSSAGGNAGGDGYGGEQSTFGLGGGSVMQLSMPSPDQVGPSYHQSGGSPVAAAVQTKRTVEVKPVRIPEDHAEPHVVDVEASVQPVHVIFRSSSNPIMVNQIHKPAEQGKVERTESEDEPHRVQHRVTRPIIQQVHEIIQPYRKVLQEIRPVVEDIRTVVAKSAEGQGGQGGQGGGAGPSDGGAYGGGSAGGYGGGRGDSGSYGGGASSYGGGLGGGAGASYSDSIPSMSVLPSPLKYRSRKAHSRRLGSVKRYSRRA